MSESLFSSLARGLSGLLAPIVRVVEEPGLLPRLLAELGVPPDASNNALLQSLAAIAELKDRIEALSAQERPSFDSIASVLGAAADAFAALRNLEQQGPLAALEGLGRELVDLLLMVFLERSVPAARPAAALLTLLEPADERLGNKPVAEGGRLVRDSYRLDRWHLDRLPALLKDPLGVLRAEYGNAMQTVADANAMADKLFRRLERLLRALGVSCRYGVDPSDAAFLGDAASLMDHALIVYVDDPLYGTAVESGVVLSLSSAQQGDLGLVISPFGTIAMQGSAGPWKIAAELSAGIDVVAWGRHGVTLLASPGTVEAKASVSAALATNDALDAYVIGQPDGARIEVGGARVGFDVALSDELASLAVAADVSAATLVLTSGTGDGFLASLLPSKGLQTKFDLGLAWSSEKGLTLRGSAGLDATLPIRVSIAGVTLSTVHLSLQPHEASVLAEVSASFAASIGPVVAVVDRVGIAATVNFPEAGGNLGPLDVSFDFKPPTGLGLAISAPMVTGGGYLSFDPQKQEYGGVLQLELAETIAVKAIGLLTTRLPDGSKGYSLLILISAEGFAPIQLGFGFTLTGIGGLLGVNRSVMVEVLRAGLKTGTLGSLLFPDDPIRNAPQIVSDLRAVFPPVNRRYVLGPMLQLGWGTPTLLTLELAVILELPDPVRLIILARLQALLPNAQHPLVQVRMDAVGVIDFNRSDVALDATLYDSRILQFALTGDMALRANWGAQPNFVLAVGGLHPRFAAPPGLPRLARLALSLSDGDSLQLRCAAYLALTSNTVQFGARLDLHAAGGGFSFDGALGFDALFQLAPLAFIVDVGAALALRYHGHLLVGISFEGSLSGPTPWHVQGKATIKVFFFKVSVRFDRQFGDREPPPLPAPLDALGLLIEALRDRRNWGAALPRGEPPVVTLREQLGSATSLRVHPLAQLTVRQRLLPLNRSISKIGSALLGAEPSTFTLRAAGIGAAVLPINATPLTEPFALAQYQELSDEQKLAQAAFASEQAGLQFGIDELAYAYEAALDQPMDYETLLIDPTRPPEPEAQPQPAYTLPPQVLDAVVSLGAAGQAAFRRRNSARYRQAEAVQP